MSPASFLILFLCYLIVLSCYPVSLQINYLSQKQNNKTIETRETLVERSQIGNNNRQAICKSWNGELGNGIRGMQGIQRILVEIREIGVEIMGMRETWIEMRGTRVGMRRNSVRNFL